MNQENLLNWYRATKRELPFRKNRDPYRIWISEIMAQQTRIEAMINYFNTFMEHYPTIEDLAKAKEDELLKLWQGLGYYSRAKNLKKAAQVCVEKYGGKLPKTKKELCTLPGIGEYTAGAIASIAFEEQVSAIDGNVIRVLARYAWIEQFLETKKERHILEELLAQSFPSPQDMPDFTQALMELGATICQPKKVQCEICPLQSECKGTKKSDPLVLPFKKPKAKRKIEEKQIIIQASFYHEEWWIRVHKRPVKGLLAGLYEFDEVWPSLVIKKLKLESYTHIFTHREWKMEGWLAITSWNESFLPLKQIKKEIAIPSAFQPFFQEALILLAHGEGMENSPNQEIVKEE